MADHDNDHNHEAFLDMCKHGETEKVRMALVAGVDGNATNNGGCTALMLAASNGHVAVVELLLQQQNVDVNAADDCGRTALHKAAWDSAVSGNNDILDLLHNHPGIDLGAVTKEGETVLHLLAENHWDPVDPDILRNMLNNPAVDPNARDLQDRTPIMILLHDEGNVGTEMLQVLVDNDRVDVEHEGLEDLAR